MGFEERDAGGTWLACPNGCPTEVQVPPRQPVASASHDDVSALRKTAGGS
jgi:hypothetical protein